MILATAVLNLTIIKIAVLRQIVFALYGVTNGFYVNKRGDYSLVIECEPQKWYLQGVIISLFSLATALIVTLISKKNHLSVIRREK